MNRSEINQNNIEDWLFEYCEGTLTSTEKMKVEAFVSKNPEFQEELSFWKESYLHQLPESPLPKEAQQLIKTSSFSSNRSMLLKTFAVFTTLAIILFITVSSQKDTSQKSHVTEKSKTYSTKAHEKKDIVKNYSTESRLAQNPTKSKNIQLSRSNKISWSESGLNKETKPSKIDSAIFESDNAPLKTTEVAPIEMKNESATLENKTESESKTTVQTGKQEIEESNKTITKTKLSAAQKRKLTRDIKKAQDLREREQLMKGNKPYIVPSDPTIY